jgi:DNA-binding transcriptional ArsR family regulator
VQAAFKALADPTRREILSRLRKGEQSAGELAEVFEISKAALSHHFNVLKAAGLVRSERRGQSIIYSLNTALLDEVAGSVMDLVGSKFGFQNRKRTRKDT